VHIRDIYVHNVIYNRVTRLFEFSTIGWLLNHGSFLIITKVAHIIWVTYFHGDGYALVFTKNGLGYILSDSFTNSSGHPGNECPVLDTVFPFAV
jgi:hypothetical protein